MNNFRENSANNLQMLQNLHYASASAKFQNFQLDNLVDFENAAKRVFSCKNRCRYSRKRTKFCRYLMNLQKKVRNGRVAHLTRRCTYWARNDQKSPFFLPEFDKFLRLSKCFWKIVQRVQNFLRSRSSTRSSGLVAQEKEKGRSLARLPSGCAFLAPATPARSSPGRACCSLRSAYPR